MKILYSGPFRSGSVTESRRHALISLGHKVMGLDQVPYLDRGPFFFRKGQLHLLIGPGITKYNRDIVRFAEDIKPDLVYIDSGSYLWKKTVEKICSIAPAVHYTSEFFGYRTYWYRHFFKSIGLYNAHIISNSLNIPLLKENGAKNIFITEFGYDPLLHKKLNLTSDEKLRYKSDAVFVGHWEPSTEYFISALQKAGVDVKIWGKGWRKAKTVKNSQQISPISQIEYLKVLAASKICLCFLSKWNRNQSAGRTFEIPAVGKFLMAERTAQQVSYFEEGKEAEFFESEKELIDKVQHYLAYDEKREVIAQAGHDRCLKSGYAHEDRVRRIMEAIG